MRNGLLIGMMFSLAPAFGAEHMSVAVCNIGDLPAQVIEHAEAEAAYVFQSMDAADARMRPDFIVRVRVGGHLPKAGATSLEAMGRAFRVGALIDRRRSPA